jgi:Domain of unknown function (DUF4202)
MRISLAIPWSDRPGLGARAAPGAGRDNSGFAAQGNARDAVKGVASGEPALKPRPEGWVHRDATRAKRRNRAFRSTPCVRKCGRDVGAVFHMSDRLQCALSALDAANARDPALEAGEPAELVYGRRMSETLAAFAPGASEALQIAVRGQHLERWLNPRRAYPDGRAGYIAWRNAAKRRHAERAAEVMAACGYDQGTIARAGSLVRKENLRGDPEAQTLEDVACLVFLRYYALTFAAKHAEEKVLDILVKTQRKMSPRARAVAPGSGLPAPVLALYERALKAPDAAPAR